MADPFAVLGLTRQASLIEIRAARRRLALSAHPDVGGSQVEMQRLNAAFEAAVAHATGRRPLTDGPQRGPAGPKAATPPQRTRRQPVHPRQPDHPRQPVHPRQRIEHDAPSFTIDALPVEAFEALLVVASWIGEAAVDDPPYLLEVRLDEPEPCWCRLELVPDAGATTVSLTVVFDGRADAAATEQSPVNAETVRDTWVTHLNRLGRLDD